MKYVIVILTMKLWEWESVKENADMRIVKFGPDQYNTESYNLSVQRIKQLKDAIRTIKITDTTTLYTD